MTYGTVRFVSDKYSQIYSAIHFAFGRWYLKIFEIVVLLLNVSNSNLWIEHSLQTPDLNYTHFTLCVGGFVGFCFKLPWRFQGVTFLKKRLYRMHKHWPN